MGTVVAVDTKGDEKTLSNAFSNTIKGRACQNNGSIHACVVQFYRWQNENNKFEPVLIDRHVH